MMYDQTLSEAFAAWLVAEQVRCQRIEEYNARLEVVRAARDQGDWSANCDFEYRQMSAAEQVVKETYEKMRVSALDSISKNKAFFF